MIGCSSDNRKKNDKITVVCTTFPQYDWTREITKGCEDSFEIKQLIDNGLDLHNFQPSADDIICMQSADVLIYTGGESDAWVDDVIAQSGNKKQVVINLMTELGDRLKEEDAVEGMQAEEAEDTEELEYDEHIWLSLRNASYLSEIIEKKLEELAPKNKEQLINNFEEYKSKLNMLDDDYKDMRKTATRDTIIVADRFPFAYMMSDYKLNYYAAFAGCSAETEASFETISFLSKKVEELSADVILIIENSDDKLARTIIDNSKKTDVKILTMDSIQSVDKTRINNGETYLSIMESNLSVLKEALK